VGGKGEGTENDFMDLGRPPTVELRAAVQQHLHQADHPRVLDLDAGDLRFAGLDARAKRWNSGKSI
jgi:hypothetical protein